MSKKDIHGEYERIILVDIDSRNIFYQGHREFEPLILNPSENLMSEYLKYNASFSKSFSFPKKLTK